MEDEFVVYDAAQQQLQYLVEFSLLDDNFFNLPAAPFVGLVPNRYFGLCNNYVNNGFFSSPFSGLHRCWR
jgi:hypothetical protein